ncbi:MAG: hypothetical protein L0211_08020 [Planctomycetaceae bacterium]|nr:hypothetical protein [Planctomycetaceae bacterium]
MARKVVNRKELRAEAEAAEALGKTTGAAGEATDAKGKKAAKPKAEKKPPAKRKSRAKSQEPDRLRLFWGVFNQSLKRVALFEFTQEKAARAKATELSASGKSPHFVQKVKEAITE